MARKLTVAEWSPANKMSPVPENGAVKSHVTAPVVFEVAVMVSPSAGTASGRPIVIAVLHSSAFR